MEVELRKSSEGVIHEVMNVLVVDHDSTCLTIVSKMLSVSGYQVVTANCGIDALKIARERKDYLNLILTEINLPDIGKYELLEKMDQISHLPLVIMSADDNETSKLGCLFKGAMLYLVKPLTMKSVRNLWQFSIIKGIERSVSTVSPVIRVRDESVVEENECENQSLKYRRLQRCQKGKRKDTEKVGRELDEDAADSTMLKKPKLIWTEELHNRFLHAIRLLGIDRAHPKEILQHMNVPGLRKENISSHLQKFRLSLKRDHTGAIQRKTSGNSIIEDDDSVQFSNLQFIRNSSFLSQYSGSQLPNNDGVFMAEHPFGKNVASCNVNASSISMATPSPTFVMNRPASITVAEAEEKREGCGRWFECEREEMARLHQPSHEHCMFKFDVGEEHDGIFDIVKDSNVIFNDEDFDLW